MLRTLAPGASKQHEGDPKRFSFAAKHPRIPENSHKCIKLNDLRKWKIRDTFFRPRYKNKFREDQQMSFRNLMINVEFSYPPRRSPA